MKTQQLLDSLLAHVAVLNKEGIILETNKAWKSFKASGSGIIRSDIGSNYYEVLRQAIELGNDYALKFLLGMKKVMQGNKESFTLTYPLQTQSNTFWFSLTLRAANSTNTRFIMIHEDISSTVKPENKLRETNSRYQLLFNQSFDAILITDSKETIIDANPAACDILGWNRQELLARSVNEVIDTNDPAYEDALLKRKKTDNIVSEINLIHRDKTRIPAEVSSQAFRNKKGEIHTFLILRDIKPHKKFEQDLLYNKQFTKSALNSNPGIFFLLDQNGNLIPWNNEYLSILGYSSQELSGKSVSDFVIDEQKPLIESKIKECIKEGNISVEAKIITKEGKVRDYQIQANRFEQDDEVFVVGSGTDITEQKKTEQENQKAQLMLEQLFENAPIGITILDTDNKITDVNKSFGDIFNYSPHEVVGKNINELIVPAGKKVEAETISNTTLQGQNMQTESIRLTKEGKKVAVLIGGVPVKLQNEIIAIYGIYVDISEQAEYQQKIEQTLREKETLLAELHHRVKNNLALINSLMELQLFDSEDQQLNKNLSDVRKRIFTIASTHEVLYQNGNLSDLPFNKFLRELIDNGNFRNGDQEGAITINTDAEEFSLDIDQSIPCGLLINELLSLIFSCTEKDQPADLNIRVRQYGKNVHLIIEGYELLRDPEEVKEHHSMHHTLIEALVTQLRGQLLWPTSGKGSQKFEFIFKKENGHRPVRHLLDS